MLTKHELQAIAGLLDQLDYYKLLKVASHASEEEIRNAFHNEALLLHPDQYQSAKDSELLDLSKKIYSKVIEAYRTLSSSERRKDYDLALKKNRTSGVSGSQINDDSDENEITAVRRIERTATTTAGQKFFKLAQAAFRSKDLNAAKMNIQIALNTDSKNPEFLDFLHRIDAESMRKKKS
jgi:DnaJ-class molecular chaperone